MVFSIRIYVTVTHGTHSNINIWTHQFIVEPKSAIYTLKALFFFQVENTGFNSWRSFSFCCKWKFRQKNLTDKFFLNNCTKKLPRVHSQRVTLLNKVSLKQLNPVQTRCLKIINSNCYIKHARSTAYKLIGLVV